MTRRTRSIVLATIIVILVAYSALVFLLPVETAITLFSFVLLPGIATGVLWGPTGGAVGAVTFLSVNLFCLLIRDPRLLSELGRDLAIGSFNAIFAATAIGLVSRLRRMYRKESAAREVLVRESNHRVANHLTMLASMVGLQSNYLADADSRRKFDEIRDRITALAMIHRQLQHHPDRGTIDFSAFVTELVGRFATGIGRGDDAVKIEIAVPEIQLPASHTTSLALIVSELVTNALKHGFPAGTGGTIRGQMERTNRGRRLRLAVGNDGEPLTTAPAGRETGSLGMTVIHTLAEQIDATLSAEPFSPDGRGARFVLEFANPE